MLDQAFADGIKGVLLTHM